jgi:hypothetical protein
MRSCAERGIADGRAMEMLAGYRRRRAISPARPPAQLVILATYCQSVEPNQVSCVSSSSAA